MRLCQSRQNSVLLYFWRQHVRQFWLHVRIGPHGHLNLCRTLWPSWWGMSTPSPGPRILASQDLTCLAILSSCPASRTGSGANTASRSVKRAPVKLCSWAGSLAPWTSILRHRASTAYWASSTWSVVRASTRPAVEIAVANEHGCF